MKQIIVITINALFCITVFSQPSLIPKQYKPIKEIFGDLNKDGINEKVVVYNMSEEKGDEEDNGITREIVIYKKENETFTYKLKQKIIFSNRKGTEVKVITPKYKYELYL